MNQPLHKIEKIHVGCWTSLDVQHLDQDHTSQKNICLVLYPMIFGAILARACQFVWRLPLKSGCCPFWFVWPWLDFVEVWRLWISVKPPVMLFVLHLLQIWRTIMYIWSILNGWEPFYTPMAVFLSWMWESKFRRVCVSLMPQLRSLHWCPNLAVTIGWRKGLLAWEDGRWVHDLQGLSQSWRWKRMKSLLRPLQRVMKFLCLTWLGLFRCWRSNLLYHDVSFWEAF